MPSKKNLDALSESLSKAINPGSSKKIDATARILGRVEPLPRVIDKPSSIESITPVDSAVTTPAVTPVVTPVETTVETTVNARVETPVTYHVETLVTTPVETPAATPVNNTTQNETLIITQYSTPVATPVNTPAATPVKTTTEKPLKTPVTTTVATPVKDRLITDSIDATHTASEQQIYSVMYRLTISQGNLERHFGNKELMQATGIRGDHTIRRAIDGLIEKRSIKIVFYQPGSPYGPKYRVHTPKEIFTLRKEIGLEIDPQTKKITKIEKITTPVDTTVEGGVITPAKMTGVTPVKMTGVEAISHDHDLNSLKILDDDDDLISIFRSFFGDQDQVKIRSAIKEIHGLIGAELRDRAARASTPPISPAYFIQIVKNLCSATNRQERTDRTESTHASPNQPNSSRNASKARLRVIIDRLRQVHVGGNYTLGELAEDTKLACVREGMMFDNDLFNEIVGEKSRSGD